MEITFRRGSADRPRGHAILYFSAPDAIYATYVVVPPIAINMAKYLPPMFAGQMDVSAFGANQAIPLPPIPDTVESVAYLDRLAEFRDDDLIDGGSVIGGGPESLLAAVSGQMQRYQALCEQRALPVDTLPAPGIDDLDSVLYAVMNDSTRVGELAKLAGKLRYAVDGGDSRLRDETIDEVRRLGGYLNDGYRINDFLTAAGEPGDRGAKLAALFVDRAYKLATEDYSGVVQIERRIREIDAGDAQ